jgi:hypothetical protein
MAATMDEMQVNLEFEVFDFYRSILMLFRQLAAVTVILDIGQL